MHRIREAAREPYLGALMGGRGLPVQADETFIGRTTTRAGEVRKRGYSAKEPVITLVDGKRARSFHVQEVNGATLKPILREYRAVKAEHRDAIVLARLGDFYELFGADAETGAVAVAERVSRLRSSHSRSPLRPRRTRQVMVTRRHDHYQVADQTASLLPTSKGF